MLEGKIVRSAASLAGSAGQPFKEFFGIQERQLPLYGFGTRDLHDSMYGAYLFVEEDLWRDAQQVVDLVMEELNE